MELNELLAFSAGILALLIGSLAYYRSGKPLTFAGLVDLLGESRTLAEQISAVAKVVVGGVEQLKLTGKINTNEEAFNEAMTHLQAWFPDVEPALLVPFIEDAYRGLKAAQSLMGFQQGVMLDATSEEGTDSRFFYQTRQEGLKVQPNDAG